QLNLLSARTLRPHIAAGRFLSDAGLRPCYRGGRHAGGGFMPIDLSRRSLLFFASFAVLAPSQGAPAKSESVSYGFPSHAPELAREMVMVSHNNVARVREVLAGRPALA